MSREIEAGIQALIYAALVEPRGSPAYNRATQIGRWYDCMRNCMVDKWRTAHKKWQGGTLSDEDQKKLTKPWQKFCDDCSGSKAATKTCCEQQVRAEQAGFEDCTSKCGKWNADWGRPGFGLMKGWDYDNSDFNNIDDRISYGIKRCCEDSSKPK